jgi:hypothetical protein
MQDIVVNFSGAFISGILSIIGALIPYYLEKRKPRDVVLKEIEEEDFYHYSYWHLLFAISLPLVCFFLTGLYALFYGVGSYLMIAEQMPDAIDFLASFDATKSPETFWYIGFIEVFLLGALMFVSILFCSKFLAHRTGRKAGLYVFLSVTIVLSTDNILTLYFWQTQPDLIVINAIVSIIAYFVAAYLGVVWAKKTQERFIVSHVFSKLPAGDKEALRDLVQGLVVSER